MQLSDGCFRRSRADRPKMGSLNSWLVRAMQLSLQTSSATQSSREAAFASTMRRSLSGTTGMMAFPPIVCAAYSSRTTTSPAFTLSPPITPPVGCLNVADHGSTGLGNIFLTRAPRKMFTKRGQPCCGETRADGNQTPTS